MVSIRWMVDPPSATVRTACDGSVGRPSGSVAAATELDDADAIRRAGLVDSAGEWTSDL